jgi:hypothetical protein
MADATTAPPGSQSTGEQVTEKAQQIAGQAQEKAGEAAQQAQSRLREQVDQRSTQAGERVGSTASDMRAVAEQLRRQGKDQPARLAEQAADRAERLGSYLTESDADRILRDVEDLARRQPWAVVAGGLFLGFAASRLLKASSTDRYQRSLGATGDRRALTNVEAQRQANAAFDGEGRFERPLPPGASA